MQTYPPAPTAVSLSPSYQALLQQLLQFPPIAAPPQSPIPSLQGRWATEPPAGAGNWFTAGALGDLQPFNDGSESARAARAAYQRGSELLPVSKQMARASIGTMRRAMEQ